MSYETALSHLLASLRTPPAASYVQEMLREGQPLSVRMGGVMLLATWGGRAAIPMLAAMRADEEPALADAAAYAIRRIRQRDEAAYLRALRRWRREASAGPGRA